MESDTFWPRLQRKEMGYGARKARAAVEAKIAAAEQEIAAAEAKIAAAEATLSKTAQLPPAGTSRTQRSVESGRTIRFWYA